MKILSRTRACWALVLLFGVAMAWFEAAAVYYLRALVDRIEPYQRNPLPIRGDIGWVELVREATTLVMLLVAGALAGRTWRQRFGYTAIAFGTWDIFYYVFLRVMTGWPRSVLDWDVLFLLPLPWWGPVLAPVSIALLMIVWGTLASQLPGHHGAAGWRAWNLNALGIALALYVFMADSIRVAGHGLDATRQVLPITFHWTAFGVALLLMAAPIVEIVWRSSHGGHGAPAPIRPVRPQPPRHFPLRSNRTPSGSAEP